MSPTDPISVILIIGAAVVGPVEAKEECFYEFGLHRVCYDLGETVAQTCARAMGEIGARQLSFPVDPRCDDTGCKYEFGWIKGGQRVLCIPAPSGLKR